jgi:hypothetical protein
VLSFYQNESKLKENLNNNILHVMQVVQQVAWFPAYQCPSLSSGIRSPGLLYKVFTLYHNSLAFLLTFARWKSFVS